MPQFRFLFLFLIKMKGQLKYQSSAFCKNKLQNLHIHAFCKLCRMNSTHHKEMTLKTTKYIIAFCNFFFSRNGGKIVTFPFFTRFLFLLNSFEFLVSLSFRVVGITKIYNIMREKNRKIHIKIVFYNLTCLRASLSWPFHCEWRLTEGGKCKIRLEFFALEKSEEGKRVAWAWQIDLSHFILIRVGLRRSWQRKISWSEPKLNFVNDHNLELSGKYLNVIVSSASKY